MKFQITAGDLTPAVAWAAKIAPGNPPMPMLGGIQLTATADGLTLAVTDLNTFGSVTVAGTVTEDGVIVVSARLLAAITKTLRTGDQVTAGIVDRGLELRSGRARWVLPALGEPDGWPVWPDPGDPIGTIRADVLVRGLERVLPAVSTATDGLPVLLGVAVEAGETLTVAATDRYRMAVAELDCSPAPDTGETGFVAPTALLRAAMAVLGGSGADVTLHSDGNTASVVSDRHTITGRLIDGTYPSWRPIAAQPERNAATTVCVDTSELAHAADQAAALANAKDDAGDLLRIEPAVDGVAVTLAVATDGDATASVDVHHLDGEDITVGVRHQYLRDALACLGSPMVVLTFQASAHKAFMLRPADSDGKVLEDGYGHVLMARSLPAGGSA